MPVRWNLPNDFLHSPISHNHNRKISCILLHRISHRCHEMQRYNLNLKVAPHWSITGVTGWWSQRQAQSKGGTWRRSPVPHCKQGTDEVAAHGLVSPAPSLRPSCRPLIEPGPAADASESRGRCPHCSCPQPPATLDPCAMNDLESSPPCFGKARHGGYGARRHRRARKPFDEMRQPVVFFRWGQISHIICQTISKARFAV